MNRKAIALLAFCSILMFAACDMNNGEIKDGILAVNGAEDDVVFTIDGVTGYVFTTSPIEIEDSVVVDGNCASTYINSGINGFAGLEDVKGFFLPLEIVTGGINEGASITAVFDGNPVLADILKSGNKYYAVIRLTDDLTYKFYDAMLNIEIISGRTRYTQDLRVLQRIGSKGEGLVLNPVIVSFGLD